MVPRAEAVRLSKLVRETYLDSGKWRLFPETRDVLEQLSRAGWTHLIVSNHVPELERIVEILGIRPFFAHVFSSGVTGIEKPHPRAFGQVLDVLPPGSKPVVVGDNVRADIGGAEAAGLPAILVRTVGTDFEPYCESLTEVEMALDFLGGSGG